MTTPTNKQLREFILASFNETELGLFCFDHFEEAELYFSDNMPMLDRAVTLIKYCRRQGKMADLLRALAEERPSTFQQMLAAQPPKAPAPTANETNSFIHVKTGLEFVRIPAGEFLFGEKNFRIYLPEYWMCKTPVTFAAYQRFIRANPQRPVPFVKEDRAEPYNWDIRWRSYPADKVDHPIVLVSWYDAVAFCEWADLQLPIEEQWEKAARGTDGRIYPWRDEDPNELGNFNKNVGSTTSVGLYSPQTDSPYGCVDMNGNVWEWCLNKYDNQSDISVDRSDDPRVVRGGSWYISAHYGRAAYRYYYPPYFQRNDLGFRPVMHHFPT